MNQDYSLFFKFLETYTPGRFKDVNRNDALVVQLEESTQERDQFYLIADPINMNILWVSQRSTQMVGTAPEDLDPYLFLEASHPEDLDRHALGRAKMLDIANNLFIAQKGTHILSTNLRLRNALGTYSDLLFQLYLFYSELHNTVFLLEIHTNIDSLKSRAHRNHYYIGDDLANYRFPDDELLKLGSPFTNREFEIIIMIEKGLNTERIANELSLSIFTVNTHRGNILKKTVFNNISDLIFDLKKRGLLR